MDEDSPSVKRKGIIILANHPPSQIFNKDLSRRFIRSKASELRYVVMRLENLNRCDDEADHSPKVML